MLGAACGQGWAWLPEDPTAPHGAWRTDTIHMLAHAWMDGADSCDKDGVGAGAKPDGHLRGRQADGHTWVGEGCQRGPGRKGLLQAESSGENECLSVWADRA